MTAAARLLFLLAFSTAVHSAEPWEAFFDPFLGDLKSELADAAAAGKKGVLVMYHFEECPYCRRMKREVLLRPDVQRAYHADFTVVAIDTRGAQAVTGVDGKVLAEKALAKKLGVRATPSFDFYAPGGERMYRHVGGIFDAREFLLLERYVASGAFRSQTFAQFKEKEKRI